MAMKSVTPEEASALCKKGARLVDIREADEYAREHIAGARSAPLSQGGCGLAAGEGGIVIFHCKSGMRTGANAGQLAAEAVNCETYVLDGGLDGWKRAGFDVVTDRGQPMEISRQVQISAGSLVVIGFLFGLFVHPAFHALSAMIGLGLVFAGVSGFCGMARFLMLMPWNRQVAR